MARVTQQATELASAIDESPSRVQAWLYGGYGPAMDITPEDHFRKLAPLMGTGRDGNVATIKMAAGGYPCLRLRDALNQVRGTAVIASVDEGPGIVESDASTAILFDLLARPVGNEIRKQEEPDIARIRTKEALLPVGDALDGVEVDGTDVAALRLVVDAHNESAGIPSYDDGSFENEKKELAFFAGLVNQLGVIGRDAQRWIGHSDSIELVKGVVMARKLVDLLILSPHFADLGDEDQWRLVGQWAPTAQAMVELLRRLVDALPQVSDISELTR